MTELLNDVGTPSDAELISSVRGGDVAAYGVLFSRHRDAANRLSRQLVRGPDADDLVSEAFAKVLVVLQRGGGPDVAFRAYLLTAVRRLHVDRVRHGQRLQTTDDMATFDPGVPFQDTAVAGFENGAAAKAFASLPERWQLVLWHLEVEGQKPADIAPLLGMSANSVSALAYRAREGLRQAFLTMHLSDISETECRWVNEHLGAFVRKGLAKRDSGKVRAHLDECRRCTAMHLELTEVNSDLAAVIAPLLLGAAAAGYLASTSGVSALGVLSLVSRAKEFTLANTGGVVAGAVSVGVAAAAVVAIAVSQSPGGRPDVVADPPAGFATSISPSPGIGTSASPGTGGSGSPTTAPRATLTSSPSPSEGPAPSESTTGSTSAPATPSLPVLASGPPTGSQIPTTTPPAGGSPTASGPTTGPGTGPSTEPSLGTPAQPSTPERVVGDPLVSADGTVTIGLGNLQAADVQADARCHPVGPRHITCVFEDPARDETVALGLAFPGYMVEDDLSVTASVDGAPTAPSVTSTFHPSRVPSFDFTSPTVEGTATHTVADDVDRYDFTTTAQLPPRVRGLVYRVLGARFRPADAGPCTVGDAAATMTCPDVGNGDRVDVPLAADGLAVETEAALSVAPVVPFDDPEPGDRTTALRLQPGADLSLDLAVLSANPSRSGLVAVAGTVSGLRTGLSHLTYTLTGAAAFESSGSPAACTSSGRSMTCPAPADGQVALEVRPERRDEVTPVTIEVTPSAPFTIVGAGPHAVDVTLPGRAVHDFSLDDIALAAHTVSSAQGGTDVYTLSVTVGALPAGASTAAFALTEGGAFAADQTDPGCRLDDTPEGGGQVVCDGLSGGGRVSLVVESTTAATHDASVEIRPTDPFDDLDPGNNSRTAHGLRPGSHLVLTPVDLGSLHQDAAGSYPVTTRVSGVRTGLGTVRLDAGEGASIDASRTPACTLTGGSLACAGLADGDHVSFTVASETPARRTVLAVTASPGGDFVDLYDDRTATADLVPRWDFAMGDLTLGAHSLVGNVDQYTLSGAVRPLPPGLDALVFTLTDGGAFADAQDTGCARLGPTRLSCDGMAAGRVIDFHVTSGSPAEHPVRVVLEVPDGYDDPDAHNQAGSATVRPGVDLRLADLDPDNESPANDDDDHLVATRLEGVRRGMTSTAYTLTGDAIFVRADQDGCAAAGRSLTCTGPVDGSITFTVRAGDARTATPIGIEVTAPGFDELRPGDNTERATLAPRPTYDFSVGALELADQHVVGDTDQYTLRTTLGAVPDGVPGLTLRVDGGTVADEQSDGCARTGETLVTCRDLAAARSVDLRVDSTSGTEHPLTVQVQAPRSFHDPVADNDGSSVVVRPGVDLHVGALAPADPVPSADSYRVSTVLSGVRGDRPVSFSLPQEDPQGPPAVTFEDSSCPDTSAARVICASPSEGQRVTFTLGVDHPSADTPVTITASPDPGLLELDTTDNAASTSLAPDVEMGSLTVLRHRRANLQAVVRVRVSGAPRDLDSVRIGVSGDAVDAHRAYLTGGRLGADGEGPVDCRVSDGDGRPLLSGAYATCIHVGLATRGSFFVDTWVVHPHGTSTPVTFTVLPLDVDEGTHLANDARTLILS